MTQPDHILIVDDDREIRELLSAYLSKNGFKSSVAEDGRALWAQWREGRFDLIVLDLMLPGDDGLTLCRDLRARSNVPIIMLTALDEDADRILGLEMGADDYLAKPFNPRELLARIKGVLRRTRSLPGKSAAKDRRYRFGDWRFDPLQRQLEHRDGRRVELPGGEARLLQIFLEHPRRPLSRDQLMEWTQNRDYYPTDRSIDVQVSRLRKRLQADEATPVLIQTLRNLGYQFAVNVEVEQA